MQTSDARTTCEWSTSLLPTKVWLIIEVWQYMSSYQYRKSHCGDETIWQMSYLHSGFSYAGKITSLYWIRATKAFAFWRSRCSKLNKALKQKKYYTDNVMHSMGYTICNVNKNYCYYHRAFCIQSRAQCNCMLYWNIIVCDMEKNMMYQILLVYPIT